MFKKLRGMFSNDLSIDLGTANTLIYVRGRGIVLDQNMPDSVKRTRYGRAAEGGAPAAKPALRPVAVQDPRAVDTETLKAQLPRGRAEVRAVKGGLNVPTGQDTIVIAQASVEAFLPPQTGWQLKI